MRNVWRILIAGLIAGLIMAIAPVTADDGEHNGAAAEAEYDMVKYYVVLLRRGPEWTAEQTPEVKEVQAGHMANIQRLAEAGTLILAGPFDDPKEELAGLFIFRVDSMAEAERLTETDPAVASGRLVAEVVPWWGPSTLRY